MSGEQLLWSNPQSTLECRRDLSKLNRKLHPYMSLTRVLQVIRGLNLCKHRWMLWPWRNLSNYVWRLQNLEGSFLRQCKDDFHTIFREQFSQENDGCMLEFLYGHDEKLHIVFLALYRLFQKDLFWILPLPCLSSVLPRISTLINASKPGNWRESKYTFSNISKQFIRIDI